MSLSLCDSVSVWKFPTIIHQEQKIKSFLFIIYISFCIVYSAGMALIRHLKAEDSRKLSLKIQIKVHLALTYCILLWGKWMFMFPSAVEMKWNT